MFIKFIQLRCLNNVFETNKTSEIISRAFQSIFLSNRIPNKNYVHTVRESHRIFENNLERQYYLKSITMEKKMKTKDLNAEIYVK